MALQTNCPLRPDDSIEIAHLDRYCVRGTGIEIERRSFACKHHPEKLARVIEVRQGNLHLLW